jgi:hypothetical protein
MLCLSKNCKSGVYKIRGICVFLFLRGILEDFRYSRLYIVNW